MFEGSTKWQSLRKDFDRYGIIEVCIGEVLRQLKDWISLYKVSSRTLGKHSNEKQKIVSENRILTSDEIRGLLKLYPDQFSNTFIDQAIERGDICVGAFVNARLAAFLFCSLSTAPDKRGLWVRVKKPYRYGYKSYTNPEYRGLRIRLAYVSDTFFLDRGFTHAVSYIERHNLASLKRQHRRGQHSCVGYVIVITLFGQTFLHHTPGVKKIGFELYQHETDDQVPPT